MKKLGLLFVSVLTLGMSLTSCSNDDESSSGLEGKWEFFEEGVSTNGQEVLVPYEHTDGCEKDFTVIGATTVTDHYFTMQGTTCEDETDVTAYTRNGNTLTFNEGSDTYVLEIVQLDGSTLKVKAANTVDGQNYDNIVVFKRAN